MIVMEFAAGNRKALKPLLSTDVYEGFLEAIGQRDGRGEKVETRFVGINKAEIVDSEYKNKTAQITVRFLSQLITATRSKAGELIDGDPMRVRELSDIWTFAREIPSSNPNWRLIATQPAS
jgi:predicted lipid-binding transport protein (Tim44 family)